MGQFSDYISVDIARHASQPVAGSPSASEWNWPGAACTASLITFYPLYQNRTVTFARWVLAWNPNTGAAPTYVRLVNCLDGPTAINEMARQTRSNANTPYDDAVDITAGMASIWPYFASKGTGFHLGHQTFGNGTTGPLIYSSTIELGFA